MYKTPLAVSATIVLAFTLAGCGSSGDSSSGNSSDSSSSAPQGIDTGQLSKIQDCLKAAGLASDMPSGMPSGMPSNMPTDIPSDASGAPSGMPSGGAGGGAQMNDPAVQDALKACGITLPGPGANQSPS